jgi:hypothetical protein
MTGQQPSLPQLVSKGYLELLEQASQVSFTEAEYDEARKEIVGERKSEQERLKNNEDKLKAELKAERKKLDALNKSASVDSDAAAGERHAIQCTILNAEAELADVRAMREHGVPVKYENKLARLDVIQKWPDEKRKIDQVLASGQARGRKFGDVEDIGVRVIAEDQQKDIKTGQDAVREMRSLGLMPPEIEDAALRTYVERLGQRIAENSDLRVPLKVTVLDSNEINAFALPGGFLFVNLALIRKADTESELAGVIAHEIAHVSARHGARLTKRATIANIFYQAAQIAAVIFTGGVAGVGLYYGLQYGFYGLGLILDLALLGVNRDFEMEADQLGVQYAWNSGFDPKGFITFFDKMAAEEGYVISASFFRTHPAFFDRIVTTFSEIEYLPEKGDLQMTSSEFVAARESANAIWKEKQHEEGDRPSLKRVPGCEPRKKPIT